MNIISCHNCGAVIDKDRLVEVDPWDADDNLHEHSYWDHDAQDHKMSIGCPVCEERIRDNGDQL
jgi:hypothetical protein